MIRVDTLPWGYGTMAWELVSYDLDSDGSLESEHRFFMGQAEKVCHRLLGQDPYDVAQAVNRITGRSSPTGGAIMDSGGKLALGGYIMECLDITEEELRELDKWALAVE